MEHTGGNIQVADDQQNDDNGQSDSAIDYDGLTESQIIALQEQAAQN